MKKNPLLYNLFQFAHTFIAAAIFSLFLLLLSCDDNEPKKEDTPELITQVTLTFTPQSGGSPVIVTATDPDGEGVQDLMVDGPIVLQQSTSYSMSVTLINDLADPGSPGYDITSEVRDEDDEHLFFFSWTNNLFASPAGNGNIDNRGDPVNYDDQDANGQPLGLETLWTTSGAASGTFRVLLKHQPELKTASSGSDVGETDLDITFTVNVP